MSEFTEAQITERFVTCIEILMRLEELEKTDDYTPVIDLIEDLVFELYDTQDQINEVKKTLEYYIK